MNKPKIFLGIILFTILVLLSETLYLTRNKLVFYSYTLNIAKTLNSLDNTKTAFYLATLGKYKLPDNPKYKINVENDFKSLPKKLGLPVLLYYFALSAYNDNMPNMFSDLLNISIMIDPDFSFWRVELANYYILIGNMSLAKNTLEDCIKFDAPRKHCQDYMNNNYLNKEPQAVGFLKESVKAIYELYPNL